LTVAAVTGCSGYIGSRLLRFLQDYDHISTVIGVDVRPPAWSSRKLEFHRMDVRDRNLDLLFKEKAVDKIIHLAFVFSPHHDRVLAHDVDVEGTRNVLGAAEECGAGQLIVTSSTSAMGVFADNPYWFTEESEPRRQPNSVYASDKFEVEAMTREFAEAHNDMKIAVVRPCIVFGPNVDNYLSRFILRFRFVPAVGGARPDMQFVHEDDAAEVFMRVLENNSSGFFHAVGDGTVNLERIAELAGKRIIDVSPGLLYRLVDLLWRLHAPGVEGPSGMLDFIRYRWTASDDLTRKELGIVSMRSSEDVLRLMLESKHILAGNRGGPA
jgi:UDP-glucose 4-epimerase